MRDFHWNLKKLNFDTVCIDFIGRKMVILEIWSCSWASPDAVKAAPKLGKGRGEIWILIRTTMDSTVK